jgi:tripartite tricarboxylate transporter family receptor
VKRLARVDLDPVARLPSNPVIVVTRKNFPAANLKELIDQLSPGKISAGTADAGSGSHIAGLLLQSLTGVHLSFVPYRGTNVTAEWRSWIRFPCCAGPHLRRYFSALLQDRGQRQPRPPALSLAQAAERRAAGRQDKMELKVPG